MSDLEKFHQFGQTLTEQLRLQTFPLAIKLMKNKDKFPEKTRSPSMLNLKITMCQGYTFSRRIGWTMGLTAEDMKCTPNIIAYGFAELKNNEIFLEAFRAMDYYETDDLTAKMLKHIPMLKPSEYEGVVISPLGWTKVVPDVILIYGDSAQIMRLIQATLYKRGEPITAQNAGLMASCGAGVLQTFISKEPNIVIPGTGDRVYAVTQDHEVILTLPVAMLEDAVNGLTKAGYSQGVRYPLPVNLAEPPLVPEAWKILERNLKSK